MEQFLDKKIILRGIQGYIKKVIFLVWQEILAFEATMVSQRSASSEKEVANGIKSVH